MPPAPADVQACVLRAFDALPAKCKPRARDTHAREWVPLAGIVLSTGTRALSGRDVAGSFADHGRSTLTCAALGTGMKCLPATKVASARGVVLHDWHAEVLALRAFNRFLVDECAALVSSSGHVSDFVRRRDASETSRAAPQPFALRSDVEMHMYCSEAPCGDASMELTMGAQEDPTPWSLPANPPPAAAEDKDEAEAEAEAEVVLRGRGYFSELGVVRRKPARPDAPPTLSKSCTDKIALKQCASLLNAMAALLLDPRNAYLSTLVLPESQHVPTATTRAFSTAGRMAPVSPDRTDAWLRGYSFRPFDLQTTSREFEWSRRSGQPGQKLIPCNLSALCTPRHREVIINGSLQGRKQGDLKGASVVSRRAMWSAVADVVSHLEHSAVPELEHLVSVVAGSKDYAALKNSSSLLERERMKSLAKADALRGWVKNVADDSFNLD